MAEPHYVSETQLLRRIAGDPNCRFIRTKHVLERMEERQITAPEMAYVLMNGQVVLQEMKRDRLWRVAGSTMDGRRLEIVAVVYEDTFKIKLVSVFEQKAKR